MSKFTIIFLVVILVGIVIGLAISYRMIKAQRHLATAQGRLAGAYKNAEDLTAYLDKIYPTRMVFLHHSVGHGFMYRGGLRDSLLDAGVVARSCTYGDEIGQETDICHWLPKFRNDMDRIIDFKAHPDKYYGGTAGNDIIMFKSCFPNSNIVADGAAPGDPTSIERTISNYKATFEGLKKEITKYPEKLFIYITAPANTPGATTPENAARAREFNTWLVEKFLPAYREETGLDNFAVYDLFGFLAADDNFLRSEYRQSHPQDSHPNDIGKQAIAADFMKSFRPLWTAWQENHGAVETPDGA